MDWMKQSEEIFKTWMDTQKKMWNAFSDSVDDLGKTPSQKMWEQTIANGHKMVKNTLEAQTNWLKAWAENMSGIEGIPDPLNEGFIQFQEMVQRWTTTQEKLWESWFELLKKLDPAKSFPAWGDNVPNPFEFWQETTKQAMDTQMAWMKSWMSQFTSSSED